MKVLENKLALVKSPVKKYNCEIYENLFVWTNRDSIFPHQGRFQKHFTYTAQKMKFPIKDFFSKCEQNLQFLANLVAFTEEIPNGKLHFLCSVCEMFFVQ